MSIVETRTVPNGSVVVRRSALIFAWLVGVIVLVLSVDGLGAYASQEYDAHNLAAAALYAVAVPLELLVLVILLFRWFKVIGGWKALRRGLLVVCVGVLINLLLQVLALYLGLASII